MSAPTSSAAQDVPAGPKARPAASAWTPARAALAAAGLAVAALAAERLWLIPVRVSFNPDEGWNAFQAMRAFGAGALYPPPGGLTGDNYPPLSFLLIGGLTRLTGADPIVLGRLVSLAAVLATAAGTAWAVRRLEPARTWAPAAAALLVLGFAATQFRAYLAMNDPQWLAHALMTPALALLLPARADAAPHARRTALAALLVVVGGLVKHNLLALPVAATLWLALRHRRSLAVWTGVGALAAAAGTTAIVAAYGTDALRDVLEAPRHGSALRMVRAAAGPLLAQLPLLACAAPLLRLRRVDRRLDLPLLFIAVAVPFGVFQRSGQGVNFNAHFEALIALAVGAGVALARAIAAVDRGAAGRRIALLLSPFVVLAPLAAQVAWAEATGLPAARGAWRTMEARIAGVGGPVACQTPALCFWAGQPFVLDTFLYGQRLAIGGDASALTRALESGAVAAVELDPPHPLKRGDAADPIPALVDARAAAVVRGQDGRRLVIMRAPPSPRLGAAT